MRVGRQGAILMLAAVVLWTALPGVACWLSMPKAVHHPSCCTGMDQDGGSMNSMDSMGSQEMRANGACCQAHEKIVGLVPVLTFAPEQLQRAAVAPDQFLLPTLSDAAGSAPNSFETPPPKASSGVSSILRV